MASKLQEALNDPKSVFDQPRDVLKADYLSNAQKRDVLKSWEEDARELQVAAEEGMAGGEEDMLGRIRKALAELHEDEPNESAPTKQG